MAELEMDVMNVLLKTLRDRELIGEALYRGAVNLVPSAMERADFFRHPGPEEAADHGCA